jgi:hypothetical protein
MDGWMDEVYIVHQLTIKAGVFFFCKKILIRKQKSARRRPKVS